MSFLSYTLLISVERNLKNSIKMLHLILIGVRLCRGFQQPFYFDYNMSECNQVWCTLIVLCKYKEIKKPWKYESLRKVISHDPKFREPTHLSWKHNFKIIMDAVEDYTRRWIKREVDQDPELVLARLGQNNQVSSTRSDSQTHNLC